MTHEELEQAVKHLYGKTEFLSAYNDVLSIALKRAVLSSPDPKRMLTAITKNLNVSVGLSLYSTEHTEAYLAGFDVAAKEVAKWHDSLPPSAR